MMRIFISLEIPLEMAGERLDKALAVSLPDYSRNRLKTWVEAGAVMVDGKDLPLHCPTNKTPAWNSHPRVFLDITKTGEAKCPYCGAEYKLIPGTEPHGH